MQPRTLLWRLSQASLPGLIAAQVLYAAQPLHADLQQKIAELPGYWHGQAIETPVGSMNYDILFHGCPDGSIAGVAKTGTSLHYWKFEPDGKSPEVRFLSTFRGNREPTPLQAEYSEAGLLALHAPGLDLLTLEITFSDKRVDIRVFHHRKPHVHIRLNRAKSSPMPVQPHHDKSNSCRGAPAE